MTDPLPQQVLDYWHSIEFFNHYDLDQQIRDARSGEHAEFFIADDGLASEEWHRYQGKRRNVYLLPFDVRQVVELASSRSQAPLPELVRLRDEEFSPEGWTCFARLPIGADGKPDWKTFSLSTLPWACGMLRQGRLDQLSANVFEASVAQLKEEVESAWSCREEETVTPAFLRTVAGLLRDWAGFSPAETTVAWVDVSKSKTEARGKEVPAVADSDEDDDITQSEADELPILNSFYYHDLKFAASALKGEHGAHPLRAYLAERGVEKLDLESAQGEQAIHATLDPALTNHGRWPTEPGQLQSLMQQFALNKMLALPPGGLVSVNGPPGTGKTTLVKDLIADLIVQRASALAGLASVQDGLSNQCVKLRFGATGKPMTIPLLSPALTGFEIVIASSNNGAVENLSLELPRRSRLAAEHRHSLRYFEEVATKYAGSHATQKWRQPDEPVWGLVSAALGKLKNRQRFQQVFNYFAKQPQQRPGERFIKKTEVDFDAWCAEGAMTYWHFLTEKRATVPSFDSARRRFLQAQASLADYGARQAALRKRWLAFLDAWQDARDALALDTDLRQGLDLPALAEEFDSRIRQLDRQLEQLELAMWPVLLRGLMRWFSKKKFAAWQEAKARTLRAQSLRDDLQKIVRLQEQTGLLRLWDGQSLDSHRNQEQALWQGDRYNVLRSELFAAAMELHQAFFLAAAPAEVAMSISNLLSQRLTQGNALPVWQWLFMLVPVVSSTFASIRNQFRGVDPASLGWLIIDEAGQAVPQAAVGALLRAQRAVVVGDPLQIEPVVPMPTRLIEELGRVWLGPHADAYAVHQHSVQTLADRAHGYGVRHPHHRDEYIGIPLVMHRRCDQPMFDIANKIAYRERMRHAKGSGEGVTAHSVLGKSAWWDVKGAAAQGKYVPAQGQYLFDRLIALYLAEVREGRSQLPSVYVITPFREVKQGLLDLLARKSAWASRLAPHGVDLPANLKEFCTHIGTVHTFQGKEADIVFFVLGCDETRGGAMNWAASSPNLLNVAVTRARQHCYVIGDRALWGRLRYFDVALHELGLHGQDI